MQTSQKAELAEEAGLDESRQAEEDSDDGMYDEYEGSEFGVGDNETYLTKNVTILGL